MAKTGKLERRGPRLRDSFTPPFTPPQLQRLGERLLARNAAHECPRQSAIRRHEMFSFHPTPLLPIGDTEKRRCLSSPAESQKM